LGVAVSHNPLPGATSLPSPVELTANVAAKAWLGLLTEKTVASASSPGTSSLHVASCLSIANTLFVKESRCHARMRTLIEQELQVCRCTSEVDANRSW
jgi:hypothetical protein